MNSIMHWERVDVQFYDSSGGLRDMMSGDTPYHTSTIPDSTPPLDQNSAPISKLRSTLKSELRSAFTSGVTADVK